MKKTLVLLAVTILSATSFGATIKDARLNKEKKSIEIDVAYGGGCEKHSFKLDVGSCLESFPVQCSAKLKHNSNGDSCEAYIHQTLSFSLEELGLDEEYYESASLTIYGSGDSKASIRLPAKDKYRVGEVFTTFEKGVVPKVDKDLEWKLVAVLESLPEQYMYTLVKK
jgi:hypothetical protein